MGLGNPGSKYRETRHNLGFLVADALANELSVPLDRHKFKADFGTGHYAGRKIFLAKPQDYMNNSGPPSARLAAYFNIQTDDLIVIHDDIDLAFGRIKIKKKGGSGGHNGLNSLVGALGGGNFTRVRIGIGRPEPGRSVTSHVLGRFSDKEQVELDAIVSRSTDAVLMILRDGTKEAMNHFNVKNS